MCVCVCVCVWRDRERGVRVVIVIVVENGYDVPNSYPKILGESVYISQRQRYC